jgi:hypothetical protein
MVATSTATSATALRLGVSLEACFALWMRSALPCLGFSLVYGLAGLLPLSAFAGGFEAMLRYSALILRSALQPVSMPELEGGAHAVLDAIALALRAPSTWWLLGLSLLLALAAISALTVRQFRIARGDDAGFAGSTRLALRRLPDCVGAWLVYLGIVLVLCAPIALLTWLALVASVTAADYGIAGLLVLMTGYLLGAVLLSVPLVWGSVAFSLAPFISAADGSGPLVAQWRSRTLVRGRWLHCALLVAIPMVLYVGVGSAVSSAVVGVCLSLASATGGMEAVLQGRWLTWSQWLAALPLALALPLCFAGGTRCLIDFLDADAAAAQRA